MNEPIWQTVDDYLAGLLAPHDDALAAALESNAAAGLPAIDVSPTQGKLLHILARAIGARNVLEVGTLGGYSTIWLARALPAEGRIVTLEVNAKHAEVAMSNLERAGVAGVVDVRIGPALETLPQLEAEGRGPFDLVFIDADKPNNPHYLAWALKLSRPGTLIVCDNVIRKGAVADADSSDASVQGSRAALDLLSKEPRLTATVVQTVGSKGYDGFAIAVVE